MQYNKNHLCVKYKFLKIFISHVLSKTQILYLIIYTLLYNNITSTPATTTCTHSLRNTVLKY